MNINLTAEKVLFQRIYEGDEQAFETVFNLYKNKIASFANSFIHSKADAEEIVQETFIVIWQNRKKLLTIEQPKNYIYTIARNKTYDHLAKISRDEKLINTAWINTSVHLNDTEDRLILKESKNLINSILQTLTPQKQKIFNLSRQEELSHDEIAEALGISKSRVKNVLVEVLKHLKQKLTHHHSISLLIYLKILMEVFFV